MKSQKIPRTRAGNEWTEARFWQFIRTALRRTHQRWPAKRIARQQARRKNKASSGRLKWESQCACCKKWFPDKETELDHIIECGSLRSYDDLPGFVRRLFCEPEGYQVLCIPCHSVKTKGTR